MVSPMIRIFSDIMAEVDPTMGEKEETKSRMDEIKYYTSLFLGALAINCVFGFLFLVPFVLDPAISTLMHDFVEEPVHCKVLNSHANDYLIFFPTMCRFPPMS